MEDIYLSKESLVKFFIIHRTFFCVFWVMFCIWSSEDHCLNKPWLLHLLLSTTYVWVFLKLVKLHPFDAGIRIKLTFLVISLIFRKWFPLVVYGVRQAYCKTVWVTAGHSYLGSAAFLVVGRSSTVLYDSWKVDQVFCILAKGFKWPFKFWSTITGISNKLSLIICKGFFFIFVFQGIVFFYF